MSSTKLEDACRAFVTASDARTLRCEDAPSDELTAALRIRRCVAFVGAPGTTVGPADLDLCTKALQPAGCDPRQSWCDDLGTHGSRNSPKGAREKGAPCITSLQCATDHCSSSDGECGMCQVLVRAEGAHCEAATVCEGSTCKDGVCTSGSPAGATCSLKSGGCNNETFCKPTAPGEFVGICTRLPSAGEACDVYCAPDLFCGPAKVCSATHGEGAACTSDYGFDCRSGLICTAAKVCAKPIADGAACSRSRDCASEHHCIGGTCRAPRYDLREGEPCGYDRCGVHLTCNATPEGTCVAVRLPTRGDACVEYSACAAPYVCDDLPSGAHGCVDRPKAGEGCSYDSGCADGADCVGWVGTPPKRGHCVARPHEGEPCDESKSTFCVPGLVCTSNRCAIPDANACGG